MSFTVLTIGAKVLSDQSFNKYLQASSQSESDKLYSEANVLHQAALVSAGLAASFYVYDIIRVCRYGVKNKLKSRAYKKMLRNTPVMINL
jgi:anaerobic C4-dicarboxylate transporter